MRRGWLYLLLLLALLALQARFWWGEGGWQQAQQVRVKAAAQRAENAKLQLRNDALSADVEDLKSGEAAVEERARSELGMIKPGETFYRVVESGERHAPTAAEPVISAEQHGPAPPPVQEGAANRTEPRP